METGADFRRHLDEFQPHLIISDSSLPKFDGPTALAITREAHTHIPFIFISGKLGENVAVDMMTAGAVDYVMKNNMAWLLPAVRRELREADKRMDIEHRLWSVWRVERGAASDRTPPGARRSGV